MKHPPPAYCLDGNVIDRSAKQNGMGVSENVSCTLNQIDRPGVAYEAPTPDTVFQNTGHGWWTESAVCETVRTPCGGDSNKANLIVEVLLNDDG